MSEQSTDIPWITDKPPNEEWVEVIDGDQILVVMAFYGRDGYRPHWIGKDGSCYDPESFTRWRRNSETCPVKEPVDEAA